jgi:SP family facilitated glucose transporter-like MFS transporter 3
MTQFALVLGILFADIVGFQFANEKWRWMFSLTSVMALFQLLLTPFLLESPRWLLGKNANSIKARFIIKKLRGFRYDEEVETEVGHYVSFTYSHIILCVILMLTNQRVFTRQ